MIDIFIHYLADQLIVSMIVEDNLRLKSTSSVCKRDREEGGSSAWNALPQEIQSIQSNVFKQELRTRIIKNIAPLL